MHLHCDPDASCLPIVSYTSPIAAQFPGSGDSVYCGNSSRQLLRCPAPPVEPLSAGGGRGGGAGSRDRGVGRGLLGRKAPGTGAQEHGRERAGGAHGGAPPEERAARSMGCGPSQPAEDQRFVPARRKGWEEGFQVKQEKTA